LASVIFASAETPFEQLKATALAEPKGVDASSADLRAIIQEATTSGDLNYDPLIWREAQVHAGMLAADTPEALTGLLKALDPESSDTQQLRFVLLDALALGTFQDVTRIEATARAIAPRDKQLYWMLVFQRLLYREGLDLPKPLIEAVQSEEDLAAFAVYQLAGSRPEAVGEFLEMLPDRLSHKILFNAFEAFPQSHWSEAAAFFEDHREVILKSYQKEGRLTGLLARLSQIDTQLAQSLLSDLQGEPDFPDLFRSYLQALARDDPKLALKKLEHSALDASDKERLGGSLRYTWKNSDPQGFAEHALQLPIDEVLRQKWTYLKNWPEGSEAIAADFSQRLLLRDESRFRNKVKGNPLGGILSDWADRDSGAARDWILREAEPRFRDVAFASLAENAAEIDYSKAVQFFDSIQSPQVRAQAAKEIARSLGKHDPESGIEWLRKIEPEMEPRMVAQVLAKEWSKYDVKGLIENFPLDVSEQSLRGAVSFAGKNGHQIKTEELVDWITSLPPNAAKFFNPDFHVLLDPETVFTFIRTHPEFKDDWNSNVGFFQELATADIDYARSFLKRDINRTATDTGILCVGRKILEHHPEEFDDFLSELPTRRQKDLARGLFVRAYGANDPQRGIEVALEIEPNTNERRSKIKKAVEHLAAVDRDAAYDFALNDPRLNQRERESALEVLEQLK